MTANCRSSVCRHARFLESQCHGSSALKITHRHPSLKLKIMLTPRGGGLPSITHKPMRLLATSAASPHQQQGSRDAPEVPTEMVEERKEGEGNGQSVGKIPPKLELHFTCNVCDTRSIKRFSKQAYKKGVVIVRCNGCKNNHLIADNLGWFGEDTNVEEMMKKQGSVVQRGLVSGEDGTITMVPEKEQSQLK